MGGTKSTVTESRTETIHPQPELLSDGAVTLKNDLDHDALIFLSNGGWGAVSVGYARHGNSVDLPSLVNVDAYALFAHRHWLEAVVVAINLLVVWVLARDLLKRRR